MRSEPKRDFWNTRARRGANPGTDDFLLKRLELGVLLDRVAPGSSVLDIGCGNGETLITLARDRGCSGIGVDFAEEMVQTAQAQSVANGCAGSLTFVVGSVPGLPSGLGTFDYIITERCLINLEGPAAQHQAFVEIMDHLEVSGRYLMIESFLQGLERTNELRTLLGLEPIEPPWHNAFLDEHAVAAWGGGTYVLEATVPFSSTYHFLSRVVYARLAYDRGEPLRYDSDINTLACQLPAIGDFGPVRLWVWRRDDGHRAEL